MFRVQPCQILSYTPGKVAKIIFYTQCTFAYRFPGQVDMLRGVAGILRRIEPSANPVDYSALGQQYCSLPQALATPDRLPRPPAKSNIRKELERLHPEAFSRASPSVPKQATTTVIDAMFIVQTLPLMSHKTFADYVVYILARWVLPFFQLSDCVHLVFDNSHCHGTCPKDVERERRTWPS